MRKFLGLAVLAAGAFLANGAGARTFEDGGVTAAQVAAVLQTAGYKAEVGKDDDGDPDVKSAADGTNFTIFFYGCNHTERCTSLTFQSAFHVDGGVAVDKINEWNRNKRFLKGWLDKVNDPFVEMDIDVEHGFTSEALASYLDDWASGLPGFKQTIGF